MHPDGLSFRVILHIGSKEKNYFIPLNSFCSKEKDAVIDSTYLLEFSYVSLEFTPGDGIEIPDNARLYMDGLDGLGNHQIKRDYDGAYLDCPSNMPLYNQIENYPWIPGQYRVKVIWGDSSYFTILKVKAKQISDRQLEVMRQELEDCVRGLAIDVALPRRGLGTSDIMQALPVLFYQYSLLEKEFPRLYSGVLDILQKPHQQVIKEHDIVPEHKARVWDNRTLYWLNSEHGMRKNGGSNRRPKYVLAPRSKINYDLSENQWLKKILFGFIQVCSRIQKAIENTLNLKKGVLTEEERYMPGHASILKRRQKEIDHLYKDLERCNRLQGRLWQLLNHHFFTGVKSKIGLIPITPGLLQDYRYFGVFRFWQQLCLNSEIQVQSATEYQWKRSDLLYEYWIFVKMLEILKKIGFQPVEGWIYSNTWRFGEPMFIPSIEPDTKVSLTKGKWRFDLIYDQSIPYESKIASEKGIPIWSENENNRPDLRLDVYDHEEYSQSFIFEVKYRKLQNVWNTLVENDRRKWTENMRQLLNYRIGLSSVTDYRIRPVDEVIAFYPGDNANDAQLTIDKYRITLIKFRPGGDNQHVLAYLRDSLFKKIIEDDEKEAIV